MWTITELKGQRIPDLPFFFFKAAGVASNRGSCSCVFPGCAHRLVVGLTLTSKLYKTAEFEIDNRNSKKSNRSRSRTNYYLPLPHFSALVPLGSFLLVTEHYKMRRKTETCQSVEASSCVSKSLIILSSFKLQ